MRTGVITRLRPAGALAQAAAFTVGLVGLALLFQPEITAAIGVWSVSTAYNHCFLVLPIACYLTWDRRDLLRDVALRPCPSAALLALPLAALWLAAERLGIMEGRQLVAVTMVQVLVVVAAGWRVWWIMSGPLLYLYFLVPFGEFLVPRLQDVTAAFVQHGLDLLQIPAYVDGLVIEIPEGTFFIAEACAGLRFLIASVAFGCLYALLMYRSPGRRVGFILASTVIPIIANGFRALGIVVLGHVLGSAQAAAADHIIYGWVFFSIVILLLCVGGLPFRQDQIAPVRPRKRLNALPGSSGSRIAAVLLFLALAAMGPASAAALERTATHQPSFPVAIDLTPVCQTSGQPTAAGSGLTSAHATLVLHAVCEGREYEFQFTRFSPRSTAAAVVGLQRRLTSTGSEDEEPPATIRGDGEPAAQWRVVQPTGPAGAVAAAIWVNGRPGMPGLPGRTRMAWHSLAGGDYAPLVVSVTPLADWQVMPAPTRREAIAAFVSLLQSNAVARQMQVLAEAPAH